MKELGLGVSFPQDGVVIATMDLCCLMLLPMPGSAGILDDPVLA